MELSVIQNRIYEIRGHRVMLDFDLAELYETETKKLKQAVRRNSERFPADFMFELSKNEFEQIKEQIRSQNVTHNSFSNTYMPFVFTEQGVAMLSSVLRSAKAIEVNISIMRAFVAVRNYLSQYSTMSKEIDELWRTINDLSEDNRKEFDDIYLALAELAVKQKKADVPRRKIGYKQSHK